MADEKIIYVVVAETVQHPLTRVIGGDRLVRLENTRTIVQVPGRLAAQACHAVRRMQQNMTLLAVIEALGSITSLKKLKRTIFNLRNLLTYVPTTTIILSCRDSFELEHVYNLLRNYSCIMAYKFDDVNPPVYCGDCQQPCCGEVTTAFATVPVDKSQVLGILDYLPLWTPEQTPKL